MDADQTKPLKAKDAGEAEEVEEAEENKNTIIHPCACREDDLAFLFISKWGQLHEEVQCTLKRYHARSKHKYKSLHVGPQYRRDRQ